jgi:hypothetical protein
LVEKPQKQKSEKMQCIHGETYLLQNYLDSSLSSLRATQAFRKDAQSLPTQCEEIDLIFGLFAF